MPSKERRSVVYEVGGKRWVFNGAYAARVRRRVRPGKPTIPHTQVARELGVTRQCVSAWEHAHWSPTLEHLERLAVLYRVEVVELLIEVQDAAAAA